MKENIEIVHFSEEKTEADAMAISLEFLRDSRRYCRRLDCEVEE